MRLFRRRRRPPAEDSSPDERARVACLQRWRRCEQRSARTWQAWLAAGPQQRDALFGAFERELAEEERAAVELELITAQHACEDRQGGLARSAR